MASIALKLSSTFCLLSLISSLIPSNTGMEFSISSSTICLYISRSALAFSSAAFLAFACWKASNSAFSSSVMNTVCLLLSSMILIVF